MPYRPLLPLSQVGAPRSKGGGRPQKYFLDDRGRRLILDLYDGTKEHTDMIHKHMPKVPRQMIHKWAMQLGLVHPRDTWTRKEIAFLRKNIRTMPMYQMEDHLKKDRRTIARKAVMLGFYREDKEDGYSMDGLAMVLGITNDQKIAVWVEKGWLKGEKRITELKNVKWHFAYKDIRDFIIVHPDQIDPRKFDWLCVVDLLAGDYGLGRLDNPMKEDYRYADN